MRKRDRQYLIVVVLFAVVVYANSLGGEFVADDETVILSNEWVRDGGSLWKLLPAGYYEASGERTYRPTATLLYYLEYRVWGDWRAGYHAVSVLIHAGSAALFYLLVLGLFQRRVLALLAALLFAVHPVTTEAINGIAYREDALALLPMLGAWLCHLRADEGAGRDKRKPWLWPVAWALYVVSMLAKEITVGLPVLILAHDYLFRDRRVAAMWRRRWPGYVGFVLVMLLFIPFRLGPGRTPFEATLPYTTGSVGGQAMITPGILGVYLRLMLWPVHLSADYWFGSVTGLEDVRFWGPVLALSAAGFLVWRAGRHAPEISIGVLWAVVTLGPAANVFRMVNPMAERYLYVPCAGFCLALAVPLAVLVGETGWRPRKEGAECDQVLEVAGGPGRGQVGLALSCVILAAFSVLTAVRNSDWADTRRLEIGAARLWPKAARPHMNLGVWYYNRGLHRLASAQYERVIKKSPRAPEGYLAQYKAQLPLRGPDAAISVLRLGLRRCHERRADIWRALAKVHGLKGERGKEHMARGRALMLQERYAEAAKSLRRACENGAASVSALIWLAESYEAAGEREFARDTARRVLRKLQSEARRYEAMGRRDKAARTWQEVLRRGDPDARATAQRNIDRLGLNRE